MIGESVVSRRVSLAAAAVAPMRAQPDSDPTGAQTDRELPYEVIRLGGQAAAIVPLAELRRLQAVERHASPEVLQKAEIEAAWPLMTSGLPLAVRARCPMRRQWPSCSASIREDRVVPGSEGDGAPVHVRPARHAGTRRSGRPASPTSPRHRGHCPFNPYPRH